MFTKIKKKKSTKITVKIEIQYIFYMYTRICIYTIQFGLIIN